MKLLRVRDSKSQQQDTGFRIQGRQWAGHRLENAGPRDPRSLLRQSYHLHWPCTLIRFP